MLPGGIGLPLVSLNLQHTSLLSIWSASKHSRAPQTPVVENETGQKHRKLTHESKEPNKQKSNIESIKWQG